MDGSSRPPVPHKGTTEGDMSARRIQDLSKELHLSCITLRREILRGKLPHHRAGKIILFTQEDVDTYLSRIAVPGISLENAAAPSPANS